MEKYYIYNQKYVVKQDLFTNGFYRLEQRDGEKQWCFVKSLGTAFIDAPGCFEDISELSADDWLDDEEPGEDQVYYIPDILYEKHKAYSPVESAIKMFHEIPDDDIAIYMVFNALATELIYIPYNPSGKLISLSYNEQEILALFSKPERMEKNESVQLRKCYLRDMLDILLKIRMNIVVNPFSEENIKFLLPYKGIEQFLIPAICDVNRKMNRKKV